MLKHSPPTKKKTKKSKLKKPLKVTHIAQSEDILNDFSTAKKGVFIKFEEGTGSITITIIHVSRERETSEIIQLLPQVKDKRTGWMIVFRNDLVHYA